MNCSGVPSSPVRPFVAGLGHLVRSDMTLVDHLVQSVLVWSGPLMLGSVQPWLTGQDHLAHIALKNGGMAQVYQMVLSVLVWSRPFSSMIAKHAGSWIPTF